MDVLKASATPRKAGLAGYKRIAIDLRKQVEGGRWPVGAMLPSRRDLARQYAVSLVTLDRAIGPLLADGTLRADDRRGTFVLKLPALPPKPEMPEGSTGWRSSMEGAVHEPGFGIRSAPRVGSIGIISSFAHPQEHFILHELEHVLSHRGFTTTVFNREQSQPHPSSPHSLAVAVNAVLKEGVTALILTCLDADRVLIAEELSRMNLGQVPMVCVLAGELTLPIPHVFYDNRSGGHQAMQHLFEQGWHGVTVVAPFSASWVSERIAGVRDAAQAYGLPGDIQELPGDVKPWLNFEDPRPMGYQAIQAALKEGWQFSGGVICVSDGVALGVLDAATEMGLEAGKDFAILGFDDGPDARIYNLTSLRPPMHGMAREAARLLLDHLAGHDGGLQVRLRAQVIPRASTRRPTE